MTKAFSSMPCNTLDGCCLNKAFPKYTPSPPSKKVLHYKGIPKTKLCDSIESPQQPHKTSTLFNDNEFGKDFSGVLTIDAHPYSFIVFLNTAVSIMSSHISIIYGGIVLYFDGSS